MNWQSKLILQEINLLDMEVDSNYHRHAVVWIEFPINEKKFSTMLDIWADKNKEIDLGFFPLTYDIIANKIIEQVSTVREECQNEKEQYN